jgi:hypothetical protein
VSTESDGLPLRVSVEDAGRPRVTKRTTILLTALVALATTMVAVLVDDSGSPRPAVRNTPGQSVVTTSSPVVPFQPPASAPSVVDGGSTADG